MNLNDINFLTDSAGDLVEALNELHPEKSAALMDTEKSVWWDAGARSVVRRLVELKQMQETRNVLRQ